MFTYDAFETGKSYGKDRFSLDRPRIEKWLATYPGDDNGELMPPGMTAMVQIQAYMNIITPRPPGNVHGSQRFEVFHLPRIGSTLETEVQCVHKEIRKDRRWVQTRYETRDDGGRIAFIGLMTTLVVR